MIDDLVGRVVLKRGCIDVGDKIEKLEKKQSDKLKMELLEMTKLEMK